MKIVKQKVDNPLDAITFRLPKDLLRKLTALAAKNEISRQKLVTAILEQAITDKRFELKIKG
jgi:predicted transcriptional regulator